MYNKTLVGMVVFPEISTFLESLIYSLHKQTDKEFTLLIIEDGLSIKKSDFYGLNFKIISVKNKKPIAIREMIIKYALDNQFDNLIFVDCDDILSIDRIKILKKGLIYYDIVCHDLSIIDYHGNCISNSFFKINKMANMEIKICDLLKKNYIGLGNSGFKVNFLKHAIPIPDDCIAVDWWIGLNVLFNKGNAILLKDKLSQYRQYDGNTANITEISQKDIELEYQVKMKLYHNLMEKYPNEKNVISKVLIETKDSYNRFFDLINKHEYIQNINKNSWWDLLNNIEKE